MLGYFSSQINKQEIVILLECLPVQPHKLDTFDALGGEPDMADPMA